MNLKTSEVDLSTKLRTATQTIGSNAKGASEYVAYLSGDRSTRQLRSNGTLSDIALVVSFLVAAESLAMALWFI